MSNEGNPAREETQSFSRFLVLALIGLATTLLTELGEQDLPPTQKVMVILALNLVIPGIEQIIERRKDRPSAQEAAAPAALPETTPLQSSTKAINGGLVLALILLLLAGLFLNFTLGVLLLIAWVVLIAILLNARNRLPLGSTARAFLTSVAAVSVGSALAFGGGTVVERGSTLANQEAWPTFTIETNCPLAEPQEGQADLSQPQSVPPVMVTVQRVGGQISVDQVLAPLLEPYLGAGELPRQVELPSQVETIQINGRTLPSEGTVEVDLGGRQTHELMILCN